MSATTDTPDTTAGDTPPFRYSAALAQDIEERWQDWWDDHGTFETPNPAGPLGDAELAAERGEKLFVLDMFPYPSGSGLHVGHPLGFIGTDVYARFKRMTGHNVLHTMGFDAFGLPAEQYAVETGQHPRITTEQNIANYRRQLRRLGLAHDPRRSISTTDREYYRWTQWIFSQIFNAWYDHDTGPGPADQRADRRVRRRAPGDTGRSRLGRPRRRRTALDHRRAPPGLRQRCSGQLVPRAGHGRRQRGGHRRRPVGPRQLPGLPAQHAPVDDADHRVRRPTDRRSGAARLDRRDQDDAAQLDRAQPRRERAFRNAQPATSPSSPPGPTRCSAPRSWCWRPSTRTSTQLTTPEQAEAVAEYRAQAAAKNEIDRTDDTREKTGVFTGSFATNPVNGEPIPIWIADYVLMGYGTGAIMAVPCGDQRDFEFARQFGLADPPPSSGHPTRGSSTTRPGHRAPTLDTALWPEAYIGDGAVRQLVERVARPERHRQQGRRHRRQSTRGSRRTAPARRRSPTSCATGCSAASATGASRSRSSTTSTATRTRCPTTCCPSSCPRPTASRRARSTPTTSSRTPRARSTGCRTGSRSSSTSATDRRPTAATRTSCRSGPARAGTSCAICDPTNERGLHRPGGRGVLDRPAARPRPDHPGGVDLYVGGVEHAVLHLLYARFWHKVLFDLGHVSSKEPYARLFNQGYVLAAAYKDERGIYVDATAVEERDGALLLERRAGRPASTGKMGKSLKNAVSPDEMYDAYGADTLRLYEMATGPMDASRPWETRDVVGMYRFLQRLWRNVVDEETGELHRRRRRTRRRHHTAAAPHDRHRAHRDGRAALQHGDRQADRAEQRRHEARTPRPARSPSRWR